MQPESGLPFVGNGVDGFAAPLSVTQVIDVLVAVAGGAVGAMLWAYCGGSSKIGYEPIMIGTEMTGFMWQQPVEPSIYRLKQIINLLKNPLFRNFVQSISICVPSTDSWACRWHLRSSRTVAWAEQRFRRCIFDFDAHSIRVSPFQRSHPVRACVQCWFRTAGISLPAHRIKTEKRFPWKYCLAEKGVLAKRIAIYSYLD